MKNFVQELSAKIVARSGIVQVKELDEFRVEQKCSMVAAESAMQVWVWKTTSGLKRVAGPDKGKGEQPDVKDPNGLVTTLLAWTRGASIVVAEDFVALMNRLPTAPLVARSLKDLNNKMQSDAKVDNFVQLVVVDTEVPAMPCGFQQVEMELPDRTEMGKILDGVLLAIDPDVSKQVNRDRVLNALAGLPAYQASNALAEAMARTGDLDPAEIQNYKKQMVSQQALEWMDGDVRGLDSIGGMDEMKEWARVNRDAFNPELAAQYDLPPPQGIVVAGVPGTGKSQLAKALAGEWGFSLLRFNVGAAFGKYMGDSEAGFAAALKTAEAVAPCILFLDEGEKMFAGVQGSGESDGGTKRGIFGNFLTWLQEKKAAVFVYMTVNDPRGLPSEFTRAGRFDEVWWIDVPTSVERTAIVKVFQNRYHRTAEVDVAAVVDASVDCTGAEIENAFKKALKVAMQGRRDVKTEDIVTALSKTNKVVQGWADRMEDLRAWAGNAAQLASRPDEKPTTTRVRQFGNGPKRQN